MNAHPSPVETLAVSVALPVSDPCPEKYQRQAVAATVNYSTAITKAISQKVPNKNIQNTVFYSGVVSIEANIFPATYLGVPKL